MPTDPLTLVQTTDDYGEALIDKLRPTQQRRHWWHVEAISIDKTVDDDTEFLSVDVSGTGDVTVTMPDASVKAGQCIIVYCEVIATGNSVIIDTDTTGDTIGSAGTQTITEAGKWVQLISDGVDDWIIFEDNR